MEPKAYRISTGGTPLLRFGDGATLQRVETPVCGLLFPPDTQANKMPFPPDAPKKIRDKMETGALPSAAPLKMYAGFGKAKVCDGCDTPIFPAQVQYEFDADDGRLIKFHLGCAGLWEAERRKQDGQSRPRERLMAASGIAFPRDPSRPEIWGA